MTQRKRQLSLSVFVQLYGTHAKAWRRPDVKAGGKPDFNEWLKIVKTLERGKFDFAFFADFVGSGGDNVDAVSRRARGGSFEPTALVAALAHATEKIGLVATVNTNFDQPFNLARRLASLDHLTNGRLGWNVVSSLSDGAAKSFGADGLDHEGRYVRAGEFIDVSKQLWDSWDDDAFDHVNKDTGVFAEGASAHPVHYHGEHFEVDAILDIARPIQGYPVIFQAGNSDRGREFAAQHAEVIYAAAQTLEEAQAYYADVKSRLAKYGREPEDLVVTPGLYYFIGKTREEAQEKYQSFLNAVDFSERTFFQHLDPASYALDDTLPENLPEPLNGVGRWRQMVALARRENLTIRELILRFGTVQGHKIIVGTATDIADQIEHWFLNYAADGFNLKPALVPEDLDAFVDEVVPLLQQRGIFRKDYEGDTLRENLGLKRPLNQHQLQSKRSKAA